MENAITITVETNVNADIEKVWAFWTQPEHITQWNNASDDWHTPKATNDLQVGGRFVSTMAAKDGSFSFDYCGTYDTITTHQHIAYTLDDTRKVSIHFTEDNGAVKVVETFEPEKINTIELQQFGWQAILNNFKQYTEAN